jgi:ribonuclease HII
MLIAGVDEAGRGALAGPVVVAAVILPAAAKRSAELTMLTDSKLLTARRREQLAPQIMRAALAWHVCAIDHQCIDAMNILQATLQGMCEAVQGLVVTPDHVQVDGNQLPPLALSCEAIVGGDASVAAISAASILAKTHRDQLLCELEQSYPGYGFARHKGYPTAAHKQALLQLGPCAVHRRSYAPVQAAIQLFATR